MVLQCVQCIVLLMLFSVPCRAGGDTIKDVYQCTSFFLQFLLSLLFDIDSKRTQLHNASLSSNVPSTKLDGDTHADTNGSFSEDITSRELQEQYVKLEELKQIRSLTISAAWIRDALMPSDDKNFLQDLSVSVKVMLLILIPIFLLVGCTSPLYACSTMLSFFVLLIVSNGSSFFFLTPIYLSFD